MTVSIIKAKKDQPVKKYKPGRPKNCDLINWPAIKNSFITANLQSKTPVSLKVISEQYNLKYKTVQDHAGRNKWRMELKELRLTVDKDLERALVTDKRKALAELTAKTINDELSVRQRHLVLARKVLLKANERLKTLDVSSISNKELLDFLKLGINEERRALGMVDDNNIIFQEQTNTSNNIALTYNSANSTIDELLDIINEPQTIVKDSYAEQKEENTVFN